MDTKKIVGLVTYAVGAVALVVLVQASPVATIALAVSGLVNVFFVRT